MDTTSLSSIVALIVALSVASERLVEIVKGVIPILNTQNPDPIREGWRKAGLQMLAVGSGVLTALLAKPAIIGAVPGDWSHGWGLISLGLLASGGSGFWNSIQTYILRLKDLKKLEVDQRSAR